MACAFIAGKIEECHRRARDIVNVFHWLLNRLLYPNQKYKLLGYVSDEYYQWRDRVTEMEMIILRELGFMVQPHHPISLIANYLKALEIDNPKIAQRTINYANDSFRSVACVCYQPPVLACAALTLAAIDFSLPLPMDLPWFEIFEVSNSQLQHCIDLIKEVYTIPLDVSLFKTEGLTGLPNSKESIL